MTPMDESPAGPERLTVCRRCLDTALFRRADGRLYCARCGAKPTVEGIPYLRADLATPRRATAHRRTTGSAKGEPPCDER